MVFAWCCGYVTKSEIVKLPVTSHQCCGYVTKSEIVKSSVTTITHTMPSRDINISFLVPKTESHRNILLWLYIKSDGSIGPNGLHQIKEIPIYQYTYIPRHLMTNITRGFYPKYIFHCDLNFAFSMLFTLTI